MTTGPNEENTIFEFYLTDLEPTEANLGPET